MGEEVLYARSVVGHDQIENWFREGKQNATRLSVYIFV